MEPSTLRMYLTEEINQQYQQLQEMNAWKAIGLAGMSVPRGGRCSGTTRRSLEEYFDDYTYE
eukprot:4184016-Pyramimonas_sp.AAC.1